MASCGTLTVEPPFESDAVSLESCSAGGTAIAGDGVAVEWTIVNDNDEKANADVAIEAGGSTIHEETVTVPAGSSDTFEATVGQDLEPGTYEVRVGISSVTQTSAPSRFGMATARSPIEGRETPSEWVSACSSCGGKVRLSAVSALRERARR